MCIFYAYTFIYRVGLGRESWEYWKSFLVRVFGNSSISFSFGFFSRCLSFFGVFVESRCRRFLYTDLGIWFFLYLFWFWRWV